MARSVGWWTRLALGAVVIACLAMAGAIAIGILVAVLAVLAIARGVGHQFTRSG